MCGAAMNRHMRSRTSSDDCGSINRRLPAPDLTRLVVPLFSKEVVSAILDEVKRALSEGESVTIRRFGSFQVRDKSTRLGRRNPKTGEEAEIPERRVVRFKPGNHFRNAVNGGE